NSKISEKTRFLRFWVGSQKPGFLPNLRSATQYFRKKPRWLSEAETLGPHARTIGISPEHL
ncbi:MAG: hypothetical protein WCD53_18225, partial [Microcoleus sp.]